MTTPPALPVLPGLSWSRHKTPAFSTRVASHVSGREVRLPLQQYPLYGFEATYSGLTSASSPAAALAGLGTSSLQSLMGLFLQLQGQFATFLYTDPDDNTVTGGAVATGDGATQAFLIPRALGGFSEPVSYVTAVDTVYCNGVAQPSSSWLLTAPNMLAFSTAPASGIAITADFTFAFECRFVDDQMDFAEFMAALWKLDKMSFRSIKANTSTQSAVIPAWIDAYDVGGARPMVFADFSTEGVTNHYWYNGASYSSGAAWLSAVTGSYANSSGKYVTNASGLLASIAANALPFDHDGSGNPLGLLLEGSSTNLLYPSNQASAYSVSYIGSGTVTQSGTGPDGNSNSAILIQNDTSTNYHTPYFAANGAAALAAGTYTLSIFAKAGSAGGWLMLGTSTGPGAYFNLDTGAVGSATSGATAAISKGPNGYYRCAVTFTFAGGTLYFSPMAVSANLAGNYGEATFAGASENLYVFGGQVEASPLASSYIPTTTAAASRSADSFYIPWTSTTFTAMVKAEMSAEVDNGRLLGCGAGGLLYQASGPNVVTSNGTATLSASVNAWTASNKIVISGSPSGRALSANGNAAASDTNALVPSTPADIYLGAQSPGANPGYGDFAKFGLWTMAATAAQAAALSAGT